VLDTAAPAPAEEEFDEEEMLQRGMKVTLSLL
jgi:hypothetical protein